MKTVRDILEAKDQAIRSIHPKAMVFDALKLMSEMEIGAVMVLDESGAVRGSCPSATTPEDPAAGQTFPRNPRGRNHDTT